MIIIIIFPISSSSPYVGLSPTSPQYDAGKRMEPPVSEPIELKIKKTYIHIHRERNKTERQDIRLHCASENIYINK